MFKHNIKPVLNFQRADKNNQYPLRIRTTINRKVSYYPTGIMLKKDQLVDGDIVRHPNKGLLNTDLRLKINELEKSLLESSITGKDVPKLKKNINLTFSAYADRKIKQITGRQSPATILHKLSYLRKFNEFSPDIKLQDVSKDVLVKYEDYCREKGNVDNTIWGCIKFVKTILNAAVEDEILNSKPHKGFKGVKYSDPMRLALTADEIILFENFANDTSKIKKLRDVASWFLFSVYTGLRYGDLNGFKGFVNGKVLLQTEKTGEVVSIYATEKIVEARDRLTRDIMSNQKMNDYLKIIAAAVGIEKRVTCHLARHTFAVEFLNRGGDIFILSKILGHTDLKTTQIYAKLSTARADEEMKKVWDKKPLITADQGKTKKQKAKPTKRN